MPRPKINILATNSSSKVVRQRHLVVFCSEEESQCLITPCAKIKFALQMKKLQYNMKMLSASAFSSNKIALTLNQIGKTQRAFVLNKQALQVQKNDKIASFLSQSANKMIQAHNLNNQKFNLMRCKQQYQNKWCHEKYNEKYEQIINPTFLFGQSIKTERQQCISFPFFKFQIPRYDTIAFNYFNLKKQPQVAVAKGFLARVIQHQIEHTNGNILLDWRINHGNIAIQKQVQQYFPKTTNIVQEYSQQLKTLFKQFPSLIQTVPFYSLQKSQESHRQNYRKTHWVLKQMYNHQLSFQDDFILRIVKHFKKQFDKFHQKIMAGEIRLQKDANQDQNNDFSSEKQAKIIKKSLIIQTDQKQGYLQQNYSKNILVKKLQLKGEEQKKQQEMQQAVQQLINKKKKKKSKKKK